MCNRKSIIYLLYTIGIIDEGSVSTWLDSIDPRERNGHYVFLSRGSITMLLWTLRILFLLLHDNFWPPLPGYIKIDLPGWYCLAYYFNHVTNKNIVRQHEQMSLAMVACVNNIGILLKICLRMYRMLNVHVVYMCI